MAIEVTPVRSAEMERRFYQKLFADKDTHAVPVVFDMAVLKPYVEQGLTIFRTNSAGRVEGQGWRIDFGILDEEGLIHAPIGDVYKLPGAEREHWAAHVVSQPLNAKFLKLRLGLGACIDEGDIETWDGTPRS